MTALSRTTVWRPLDWIAPLQAVDRAHELHRLDELVARARSLLANQPGESNVDEADEVLGLASSSLMTILVDCGVETPLGWRLHQLRSRLDAHLLAASALREADAGDAAASVLRRSVDFVALELVALLGEPTSP